jgi:hypothetical protein
MTTPNLVQAFYERIWNAAELDAASEASHGRRSPS